MRKSLLYSCVSISLLSLSACFSAPQTVSPAINPNPALRQAAVQAPVQAPLQAKMIQNGSDTIFDFGSKQSTASFRFTINLASGNDSFKTKVSVDGRAAKAAAEVDQVRLFLINVSALPPFDNGAGAPFTPVFMSPNIASTGASQTFTFRNVPANAPLTNHYFVAIEALDNTPAPVGNIVNDTVYTGPEIATLTSSSQDNRIRVDTNGATPGGEVWAYRSNGGGDNENSFAGGIQVNGSFAIPPTQTDTLTTFLRLWGVTGATVDANVTVNPGDAGYMGSISVQ